MISIRDGIFEPQINDAINNVAHNEGGMFIFIYDEKISDYQISELDNAIKKKCKIYAFNIGEKPNPTIDEMLSQINACKFNSLTDPVDDIMKVVLDKAFDHGSIMAYLNQFRLGKVVNNLEADLCWRVYEDKAWNSDAPYARVSLAREYASGRLVKRNLKEAYYCLQYAVKGEHLSQYEHELNELYELIKIEENNK
jgi:hypothetical protein